MKIRTAASSRRGAGELPVDRWVPGIANVPRVSLGRFPSTVQSLGRVAPGLWIKRDDLCADPMGGNKVRALEFLLAGVGTDDRVVTVGSAGSTHALAVATYGRKLGARVLVGRWRQVMNPTASRVSERLAHLAHEAPLFRSPALAYGWAFLQHARGARWIAAGGSTPLGIIGHVNAGLELVEQIDAGELPSPDRVVVPLGTGGTAAGLALAFAIAKRSITVVGVRVVPRIVGRRGRVIRLANHTARLMEHRSGGTLPRATANAVVVSHEEYGGAYGSETAAGTQAAERLGAAAITVDATYSAKALAHALAAGGTTLFWLTFDSRPLRKP